MDSTQGIVRGAAYSQPDVPLIIPVSSRGQRDGLTPDDFPFVAVGRNRTDIEFSVAFQLQPTGRCDFSSAQERVGPFFGNAVLKDRRLPFVEDNGGMSAFGTQGLANHQCGLAMPRGGTQICNSGDDLPITRDRLKDEMESV